MVHSYLEMINTRYVFPMHKKNPEINQSFYYLSEVNFMLAY